MLLTINYYPITEEKDCVINYYPYGIFISHWLPIVRAGRLVDAFIHTCVCMLPSFCHILYKPVYLIH